MTNPTLEKVARAIYEEERAICREYTIVADTWETTRRRAGYIRIARAALQSLRQVDDETVEAMADVVWRSFGEVIAYGSSTGTSVAEAAWTAAIDSILGKTGRAEVEHGG